MAGLRAAHVVEQVHDPAGVGLDPHVDMLLAERANLQRLALLVRHGESHLHRAATERHPSVEVVKCGEQLVILTDAVDVELGVVDLLGGVVGDEDSPPLPK